MSWTAALLRQLRSSELLHGTRLCSACSTPLQEFSKLYLFSPPSPPCTQPRQSAPPAADRSWSGSSTPAKSFLPPLVPRSSSYTTTRYTTLTTRASVISLMSAAARPKPAKVQSSPPTPSFPPRWCPGSETQLTSTKTRSVLHLQRVLVTQACDFCRTRYVIAQQCDL